MQQKIIPIVVIGIVIFGGVLFLTVSGKKDQNIPGDVTDLKRLSALTFTDYTGESVSLADFDDRKLLVVNTWAVWCPFCREELPDFGKLQQVFKDDITVIAIDRSEPLKRVKQYTDELGVTNQMILLLDDDDAFYRAIGGFSMPETIFIDTTGFIVFHKRGPMTFEDMKLKVEEFLLEKI